MSRLHLVVKKYPNSVGTYLVQMNSTCVNYLTLVMDDVGTLPVLKLK